MEKIKNIFPSSTAGKKHLPAVDRRVLLLTIILAFGTLVRVLFQAATLASVSRRPLLSRSLFNECFTVPK